MTDKDTLAKLAQDMRSVLEEFSPAHAKLLYMSKAVDRLDVLVAQQVPNSAWRQAITDWRILNHGKVVSNTVDCNATAITWISCRALELSAGSGEDQ